jgi:hypothetical protein
MEDNDCACEDHVAPHGSNTDEEMDVDDGDLDSA